MVFAATTMLSASPATAAPLPGEQSAPMWDVWFDTDVGQQTTQTTPIVLDLNRNGRPDITGANILGDGKVDDPILFDMDPDFISFEFKSSDAKDWPDGSDGGYWVDADGTVTTDIPSPGIQKGYAGWEYLADDGALLGQIKEDGLYHYGEQEPRELTEWLAPGGGDGLLVWDYDGDGQITSAKELFGTVGLNNETFSNGFEKLAHYFNQNGDGRVDGDELEGLQVWVDANGDGVVQEGELKSLQELGITGLGLDNYNPETMEGVYYLDASSSPVEAIPTLGQWALMLLGLLLAGMGLLAVSRRADGRLPQ